MSSARRRPEPKSRTWTPPSSPPGDHCKKLTPGEPRKGAPLKSGMWGQLQRSPRCHPAPGSTPHSQAQPPVLPSDEGRGEVSRITGRSGRQRAGRSSVESSQCACAPGSIPSARKSKKNKWTKESVRAGAQPACAHLAHTQAGVTAERKAAGGREEAAQESTLLCPRFHSRATIKHAGGHLDTSADSKTVDLVTERVTRQQARTWGH